MFRERGESGEDQQDFWVDRRKLPKLGASSFYLKLEKTLTMPSLVFRSCAVGV